MKNIHRWGFAFIAIGIALWMSGVSPQLGSILFVIGLVGLVIAWVITLDFELTHYLKFQWGRIQTMGSGIVRGGGCFSQARSLILCLVRPRANLRYLLKVDRLRCRPPRPDPSRDGLDGFWPAGQTILCERRASNPGYGARRRRRPCGATALPRDVRSGVLPRTNWPTPGRAT